MIFPFLSRLARVLYILSLLTCKCRQVCFSPQKRAPAAQPDKKTMAHGSRISVLLAALSSWSLARPAGVQRVLGLAAVNNLCFSFSHPDSVAQYNAVCSLQSGAAGTELQVGNVAQLRCPITQLPGWRFAVSPPVTVTLTLVGFDQIILLESIPTICCSTAAFEFGSAVRVTAGLQHWSLNVVGQHVGRSSGKR